MRETLTQPPAEDALWEVRPPVLLNTWKHHAGALRRRIAEAARGGEAALAALAGGMVVIGTELMDLYVGRFTPAEIAAQVVARLQADGLLAPDAYRAWVAAEGGYRLLTFAEGESVWVLRAGDEERYVHVHPARWAPATLRVRANVLKTAVMALAYAAVRGGDPMDRALLNRVRAEYLGLSPVGRDPAGEQGVGRVIDVLRADAKQRSIRVAIPRHLSEALGRLAAAEERFLHSDFLAPMPRGGRAGVRIAGVVCALRVEPADFQGWGVWRPLSPVLARLARGATLAERQRYLELFPRLRLVLCERRRGHWLGAPAQRGDTRFRLGGLVPVFLVEGAGRFEVVEARFDGTQCWFDRPDPRHDPATADYLRQSLREPAAPEGLRRRGLTAEERDAYALVLGLRAATERDRTEARLRRALAHGGAELCGYAEHEDGYRVEYVVDGRRHVSSVGRDLAVQVAGICLSGEDHRFDLHSLVGVLREAQGGYE